MEQMTQAQIAEKLGVKRSYLNDIIRGRRSCSKRMAVLLEEATGIDRVAWLYPDQHSNPMIEKSRASNN